MTFKIKKLLIGAIALTLTAQPIAFSVDDIPVQNIHAYALYDRDADLFIDTMNASTPMGIASISKLMTAKLVMDDLKNGTIALTDQVPISSNAQSQDGDGMRLRAGESVTLDDLFHGMLICSSNDAAVALSEYAGGSESTFVNRMNSEAKSLGLASAHFVNPCGLTEYDENHDTKPDQNNMSLMDINRLADQLLTNYPELTKITSIEHWQYEAKGLDKKNTNQLLWLYDEVDGLKTGYTVYAGYCQIVSATLCELQVDNGPFQSIYGAAPLSTVDDSRHIFASVLGAINKTNRNNTLKAIINHAKSDMRVYPITDSQIPLYTDTSRNFSIVPTENISLFLPKDAEISFQLMIDPIWQTTSLIAENTNVGKVIFYNDQAVYTEVPLTIRMLAPDTAVLGDD
ncbi:D-alanyl-D-alanine carboxypeptidase [Fusibacter paucivorans]|uniref:D-alanyl-D-alanine carboxypeptidase n=1 Tax=Fusibacter paucivorans TaxID=76009 RepID=A0ABS5PQG5_9FIRM|nr:serine hydrolase [Fusibacter paucivorans]MBS7527415.1 D-alanyl-D-alanine carboxypeptidase [Fusibacter paucivorans]